MNTTFNAVGTNGRDCPVCMRIGCLAGDRSSGSTLTCSGCATVFTLTRNVDEPDTLTRAAAAHTERAFPNVCRCGRKYWNQGAECMACAQAASTERSWPSGIPGR